MSYLSYPFIFFLELQEPCLNFYVRTKFCDAQVSSVFTKELVFLCRARCVLSRLCCNGQGLQRRRDRTQRDIGKMENFSCCACGHLNQNTSHFFLYCPATDSIRCSLFDDSFFFTTCWSRPLRVSRLLRLHGLPPSPIARKGTGNNDNNINVVWGKYLAVIFFAWRIPNSS